MNLAFHRSQEPIGNKTFDIDRDRAQRVRVVAQEAAGAFQSFYANEDPTEVHGSSDRTHLREAFHHQPPVAAFLWVQRFEIAGRQPVSATDLGPFRL
ncbi:hypothetical protein ACRDNQ_05940 [Palleronia sp. KMU-117]|uniref:hypothetical protein n=1 Tax=Palleronia sp. KMU-117 TaxID=3434108 RepID=UPI003D75794E